ncbi:hypothetical protein [Rhodococcus pyridinivorans]|uniref:Uncharacterized protein n=1 Tax=Rhodococcus pyridinivorans TaxID=103816 RepID=A0A7M2XKX5_9NOCA|nr:hypothetical protein [Rhodococcus pyridinivorans]QOV97641.1 hypothetical protein INP59_17110 [Rhodococcus pyridinivorans]
MSRTRIRRLLAAAFAGAFLVAACDTGSSDPVVIGEYHAPVDTWGSR